MTSSIARLRESMSPALNVALSKPSSTLSCTAVALEAIFHSCFVAAMSGLVSGNLKRDSWRFTLCGITTSYAHNIQSLFNLMHAGSLFLSSKDLLEILARDYNISIMSPIKRIFKELNWLGLTHVTCGILILAATKLLSRLSTLDLQAQTTETIPFQQGLISLLRKTQIAFNILLSCLTKNKFWLTVHLVEATYSYLKTRSNSWCNPFRDTEMTQLSLSEEVDYTQEEHPQTSRAKIIYHFLKLTPKLSSSDNDDNNCAICQDPLITLDSTVNPAIFSCASHVFHQQCLNTWTTEKLTELKNHMSITACNIDYKFFFFLSLFEGPLFYLASIDQNNLPSCPTCRQPYLHAKLEVIATDCKYGSLQAHVTSGTAEETYYNIYNVVQAALSSLYRHHKLTTTIFKIQEWFILLDFNEWKSKLQDLRNKIFQIIDEKSEESRREILKIAATIGLVCVSVLPFLIVWKSKFFTPSLAVASLLNTNSDLLKKASILWDTIPITHKIKQALYINRIMTNLALLALSPGKRKAYLIDTFSQIVSFSQTYQLRWLRLSETLEGPTKELALKNVFPDAHLPTLQKIWGEAHFMVPNTQSLSQTVPSIYNYLHQTFAHAHWEPSLSKQIKEKNLLKFFRWREAILEDNGAIPPLLEKIFAAYSSVF